MSRFLFIFVLAVSLASVRAFGGTWVLVDALAINNGSWVGPVIFGGNTFLNGQPSAWSIHSAMGLKCKIVASRDLFGPAADFEFNGDVEHPVLIFNGDVRYTQVRGYGVQYGYNVSPRLFISLCRDGYPADYATMTFYWVEELFSATQPASQPADTVSALAAKEDKRDVVKPYAVKPTLPGVFDHLRTNVKNSLDNWGSITDSGSFSVDSPSSFTFGGVTNNQHFVISAASVPSSVSQAISVIDGILSALLTLRCGTSVLGELKR